jgi:hypothetical protein
MADPARDEGVPGRVFLMPGEWEQMSAEQKPSVGRIVHYVSYGTPGGEYKSECRAAIVTEVNDAPTGPSGEYAVGLCVLNPTGQFFNRTVDYDEGGTGHDHAGAEIPAKSYHGGTWHWPERV